MKKAFFWAAAALSLAACHTEDPLAEAEQQQPALPGTAVVRPIEADITLQDYAESRAAKQEWQAGDQLTLRERWGNRLVGTMTRGESEWSIALEPDYAEYGPDNEQSFEVSAFFAEKAELYDGIVCGGFGTLQLGAAARVELTLRHLTSRIRVGGLTPGDSLAMTGFKLISNYDYRIECVSKAGSAIADEEGNAYFYVAPNRWAVDSEGNPLRESDQFDSDPYRTTSIGLEHFNADRVLLGTYAHELSEADELAAGQAVAFEMPGDGNLRGWISVSEEDHYIYYTTADNQPIELSGNYETNPYGDGFRVNLGEGQGRGDETLGNLFFTLDDIFREKNVTSVRLPKTIHTIGEYAFENCTQLQSIELPAGLKQLGANAFSGCTQLQTVELPAGLTQLGSRTFSGCTQLQTVELPAGLTGTGEYTFDGCTNLQRINLPDGVEELGNGTFNNCSSLTNITLPQGLKGIGEDAFSGCSLLTGIVLPQGLKRIGMYAFSRCSSLTEIVLPQGATEIGSGAFIECSSLTAINLPEGITSISSYMLSYTAIASLTIPESVTAIGWGAFSGCEKLASVDFPDGVETIEVSAFENCSQLTSVVLPKKLKEIEECTFNRCSRLASVTFPEGLETIGASAFAECRMSAIDLPASIKRIDDKAFAYRALKSVTCRAAVPPVLGGQEAFFATFTGPVYVPAASISAYESAEIWWDFTFEAIP